MLFFQNLGQMPVYIIIILFQDNGLHSYSSLAVFPTIRIPLCYMPRLLFYTHYIKNLHLYYVMPIISFSAIECFYSDTFHQATVLWLLK